MIHDIFILCLTRGGSSIVHIDTQTIHRTTEWKQNIQNRTHITIRIHNNKNTTFTKLNKSTQNIQPYIQWYKIQLINMNEAAILHMVYISSNNDRQPVPKTFTPLHYTCRHFTSSQLNFAQIHFTTLHYPLIWLKPI